MKKCLYNIRAILYIWTSADRMNTVFYFNNRPKQAEIRSGCHHANCHHFPEIQLQFVKRNIFNKKLNMFSIPWGKFANWMDIFHLHYNRTFVLKNRSIF